MADLPPYPDSKGDDTGDDTGVGPGRGSTARERLLAGTPMTEESGSMDVPQMGEGAAHVPQRRPGITALAAAGIIGPILFTVAFVVQGLFRLDEYNPVAETVSALEAGSGGWVQQVNFVVFGLLTIAFAVGLQLEVRPARLGWVGPTILVLSGLALLWAAVFPIREDASGVTLPPGLHLVGGFTYFSSAAVGLIVLSRRLARDPKWRGLAGYTLAAGVTAVVGFVAINVLVRPDAAPLHAWYGLAQRVLLLAVLFPPTIVLALRLLRLTRAGDALHDSKGDDTAVGLDHGSTTGTPRWVKVFGIIVIVLVLLFAIKMLTVGGGPGMHTP